jgi:hypothetical protein
METISLLLGLLGLAGDGWGLLRSRRSGDLRRVAGRLSQRLPFSASLDAEQLARLFSDRRFLDALDEPDSPRDGLRAAVVPEGLGNDLLRPSSTERVFVVGGSLITGSQYRRQALVGHGGIGH